MLYVLVINCQAAGKLKENHMYSSRYIYFNGIVCNFWMIVSVAANRASNWRRGLTHNESETNELKKKQTHTRQIQMYNTNLWFKLKRKTENNKTKRMQQQIDRTLNQLAKIAIISVNYDLKRKKRPAPPNTNNSMCKASESARGNEKPPLA